MSSVMRPACFLVLLVHCVSPSSSSISSTFAVMMATGVLSSWDASVTKRLCRSRLRIYGRMIRFESGTMTMSVTAMQAAMTLADIVNSVSAAWNCLKQSTTSDPPPSSLR